MRTITVEHISQLEKTANKILDFAVAKRIFCFYGELGAGKTTLIKEMCRILGAIDSGSSPTFSLINEYDAGFGKTLYHFDLYRLKNENEIYDIGYEDYIFSNNYCFIEWPEKIAHLLPPDHIKVRIEVKDNQRIISLS